MQTKESQADEAELAKLQALAEKNELLGLYDVAHTVYHHHLCPGISQSHLKQILKSPRHYQHWLKEPDTATPAMDFGSLCHVAILEPQTFHKRILTWPKEILDRNGKPGVVQMREEFRAAHPGKIIIDADQISKVSEIVEFVYSQERASDLLSGLFEKTFFWKSSHGPLCKAKPDCINTERRMILDLKITQDASLNGFRRTLSQLQYYLQAAFYLDGINEALKKKTVDKFVFINVEHDPKASDFRSSLDISYIELGGASLDLGRMEADSAIRLIQECSAQKIWPGYSSEIQNTEVHAWRFTENENGN